MVLIESGRSEAPEANLVERTPLVLEAGGSAAGEFRCAGCGYGVMVRSVLPPCPMCQGLTWERPDGGAFGGSAL